MLFVVISCINLKLRSNYHKTILGLIKTIFGLIKTIFELIDTILGLTAAVFTMCILHTLYFFRKILVQEKQKNISCVK